MPWPLMFHANGKRRIRARAERGARKVRFHAFTARGTGRNAEIAYPFAPYDKSKNVSGHQVATEGFARFYRTKLNIKFP